EKQQYIQIRIQIHSFNCGSGVGHLRHYKMLESCTPSTEFRSRSSRCEKPAPIALRRCREYVTKFKIIQY
ncbi:MAG: hypothetical protein WBM86_11790, partial [Waterburya sp.]